jgi:hypothetical protein
LSIKKYVSQFYIKKAELDEINIQCLNIGSPNEISNAVFDLSTKTVASFDGFIIDAGVKVLSDGGLMIFTVHVTDADTTETSSRLLQPSFGDGVSGMLVSAAQFEQGLYPTSYIPTQGSQVTRAADVSSSPQVTRAADNCVRDLGSNFNPNEFSVFFDYTFDEGVLGNANLGGIRVFGLSDGTTNNRISLAVSVLLASDSGVTNSYSLTTNLTQSGKVAISYDGTTLKVCLNGEIILTQSLSKNTELDRMTVGRDEFASAGAIVLKRQVLFPTALSEAELIILTRGA